MRTMTYAGTSFLTTNSVADALFDFIASLDRGSPGESVEVPSFTSTGHPQTVRILVWPGSELLCIADDSLDDEVDDKFGATLRLRTEKLLAVRRASVGRPSSWSLVDPDAPEYQSHTA